MLLWFSSSMTSETSKCNLLGNWIFVKRFSFILSLFYSKTFDWLQIWCGGIKLGLRTEFVELNDSITLRFRRSPASSPGCCFFLHWRLWSNKINSTYAEVTTVVQMLLILRQWDLQPVPALARTVDFGQRSLFYPVETKQSSVASERIRKTLFSVLFSPTINKNHVSFQND